MSTITYKVDTMAAGPTRLTARTPSHSLPATLLARPRNERRARGPRRPIGLNPQLKVEVTYRYGHFGRVATRSLLEPKNAPHHRSVCAHHGAVLAAAQEDGGRTARPSAMAPNITAVIRIEANSANIRIAFMSDNLDLRTRRSRAVGL